MPKPFVSKPTKGSVQRKQLPSLLSPPPGFEYQAFGFLPGELIEKGDSYTLLVDSKPLIIEGISDRLLKWLNAQQTPCSGYFGIYPKSTRRGLHFWVKCFEPSTADIEPRVFKIYGQLFMTKGDEQRIRIHRNQPTDADIPFLVKVSGFLPNSKPGQFWQLECLWEDGQFLLLDGQLFRASTA